MAKKKKFKDVIRKPTAPPTIWHKDKSKYNRKDKYKKDWKE